MKKILSGMIYRFFRSMEAWIFIALLLASSFISAYADLHNPNYEISENVQKRFESLDVSAADAYKMYSEALPKETYDVLQSNDCEVDNEIEALNLIMGSFNVYPILLIVLFIPLFFGRIFSDGTVKNLISGGHSKSSIYFSSLIFVLILDVVMLFVSAGSFAIACLIYHWHPPVYLPVIFLMFLISLLITILISSASMAVLFASMKRTASFVVGFILFVLMIAIRVSIPMGILQVTQRIDAEGEGVKKLRQVRDEEPNALEEHFSLSECNIYFSYKGDEFSFYENSSLATPVKNAFLVVIYSDPVLIFHIDTGFTISPYMMYRDGLMTINIICDIFWITLTSFCGIIVFRRKEIRC
ncbi:MAG: hypothetical protein K6E72_11835 [Saccharofermentans sp.]|nr:hypothetical protein [Saccharofermentans sp.]